MSITISYDKDGVPFQGKDEFAVFAKSTEKEFYVKKGKSGPESSHFLNPNGMWFTDGSERGFDKRSGRNVFEFTKVTKAAFDYYLKFLQTKNPAYLRNAEREVQ